MDKEIYNGLLYWGVAGSAVSVAPILIAMARHHARASGVFALSAVAIGFGLASGAMVLNFAGGSLSLALLALAAVAWIIATLWAIAGQPVKAVTRKGSRAVALSMPVDFQLPTASVKPTRWKVSGVDRQTQLDCSEVIAAESPANAKVKAELRGMVVTSIDPA